MEQSKRALTGAGRVQRVYYTFDVKGRKRKTKKYKVKRIDGQTDRTKLLVTRCTEKLPPFLKFQFLKCLFAAELYEKQYF